MEGGEKGGGVQITGVKEAQWTRHTRVPTRRRRLCDQTKNFSPTANLVDEAGNDVLAGALDRHLEQQNGDVANLGRDESQVAAHRLDRPVQRGAVKVELGGAGNAHAQGQRLRHRLVGLNRGKIDPPLRVKRDTCVEESGEGGRRREKGLRRLVVITYNCHRQRPGGH